MRYERESHTHTLTYLFLDFGGIPQKSIFILIGWGVTIVTESFWDCGLVVMADLDHLLVLLVLLRQVVSVL